MTFLPEPREDVRVQAPDGRTIAVARWGVPGGVPVIAHHGTPMSRLDMPGSAEMLASLGIDLITFDRAGYGGSTPQSGRTVASAAADAEVVADALGIERFAVYGVSGGGPHAVACAALLDQRVTRTACVVGVAPFDMPGFFDGLNELSVEEFEIALRGRAALAEYVSGFVEATRSNGMLVLDEWSAELPEADREAYLAAPEMRELIGRALQEGLAVSGDGWIDDDLALVSPWGFDLGAISTPVTVWAGEVDRLVPIAHARYLAAEIPGAELHVVPGKGHSLDDEPIFAWLARG